MGGGKTGGGEIPPEIQQAASQLRTIGEQQFALGIPQIRTGGEQAMELLQTGQLGALQPAIKQTVEQARSGATEQQRARREQLTRQGITGTALQEALAQGTASAESQIGAIPSQFTMPFLQQLAGPVASLPETGLQGIAQAGQLGGVSAGPVRQSGGAAGALGGAASGAATGAMLGSVVPGIGTAVGAVGGGLLGGLGGAK